MIDLDRVDRDVRITATITGNRATLTVGGVTSEFAADRDEELHAGVLRRVVAVATELDGPVQMTIVDDGTPSVLVVAPDGSTTAIKALLPARVTRRAAPRHSAPRTGPLARPPVPAVIVPVSAGVLAAALVVVIGIAAGGDERDPDAASADAPASTTTTSLTILPAPDAVVPAPAPTKDVRQPAQVPATEPAVLATTEPSPSDVAATTPVRESPPPADGSADGGPDGGELTPASPTTVDPDDVPDPIDPDDVPTPVDPDES